MTNRIRVVGAAVLAAAVALVAATAALAGSSGSAAGTISLKIGTPGTYPTLMPLYLAEKNGYFAKQGLKVQIIPFKGDAPVLKALVGGAVDVNVASLAGVLQGVQQGAPLKVFYGGFDQTQFNWYGKKIDWKNVKGTKWAVSSAGSSTDFLTRYLLQKHHVNPNDVSIIPTGGGPGTVNALKSGQADYGITLPALGVLAKKYGFKVVARQTDLMKQYPFHVVYAKTSWLSSHQDVAQKFLRALTQGMKAAKADRAEGIKLTADLLKIPMIVSKLTYPTNVNQIYADGRLPDKKSMATFWQIGIENGQFKKRLPDSQWLDPQWITSYPKWVK